MKQKYLLPIFLVFAVITSFAQQITKGKVVEAATNEVIPFVTIVLKDSQVGTIANEEGEFTVKYKNSQLQDSISFSAVGYKTKSLALKDVEKGFLQIALESAITKIDPVVLVSKKLSAEKIVEKILENEEANYVYPKNKVNKIFFRRFDTNDIEQLESKYKNVDISWLTEAKLKEVERNVPKHNESQIGFLGDLYISQREKGTQTKIKSLKTTLYETRQLDEMDFFKSFDSMFSNTQKKEYWRVKSGIFKQKIEVEEEEKEAWAKNSPSRIKRSFFGGIRYFSFKDKKAWEFLHKTSRYDYKIVGTTNLNDEEVYIIQFKPKSKGVFRGKMYVSVASYALVKANYEQIENKSAEKFKLLGFSTERKNYQGAVFFKKVGAHYNLKFFSNYVHKKYGVDRKLALQKKKDRFLFDKTLEEIKLNFKLKSSEKVLFDYLVLDSYKITSEEFDEFKEAKKVSLVETQQPNSVFKDLLHESALKEIEMYKHWERE